MAQKVLHKRSKIDGKIPTGATLDYGEIGVNYSNADPFLSIRKEDGSYVRISSDEKWNEAVDNVDKKFADYLPLGGGEISDTGGYPLILNTSAEQVTMKMRVQGSTKAEVGWDPSNGVFLYNNTTGQQLSLAPSGGAKLYINNKFETLLHSGNSAHTHDDYALKKDYLPLSGGSMTGAISYTGNEPGIRLYRSGGGTPYIRFGASSSSYYGEVGITSAGNLALWSYISGNSAYNKWNTIIHEGNIGNVKAGSAGDSDKLGGVNAGDYALKKDYLPLSGGTLTNILTIDRSNQVESSIHFKINNESAGWVGVDDTHGTWICNSKSATYLGIKNDNTPYFGSHTLIHSGNIGDYKAGSASVSNRLWTSDIKQTADKCYDENPGFYAWRYGGSGVDTTATGDDGIILSWSWNKNSVGGQIYLDDNPNKTMKIRGFNGVSYNTWTTWSTFLHSDNFSTWAAEKSHTHIKSEITDFPSSLPANGGNADTVDNKHASDFALSTHTHLEYLPLSGGTMNPTSFISWGDDSNGLTDTTEWNFTDAGLRIMSSTVTTSNAPVQYCTGLHVKGRYGFQIASAGGAVKRFYIRNVDSGANTWVSLIHSDNISSYKAGGATTADDSSKLGGTAAADYALKKDYLALSGGTVTGSIIHKGLEEVGTRILYGKTRNSGIKYDYNGNECLMFSTGTYQKSSMAFYTYNRLSLNDGNGQWTTSSPDMHIKNGCVVINKLIGNDTEASYNLDVNGSANATTLYENGTQVLTKAGGTLTGTLTYTGIAPGIILYRTSGGTPYIRFGASSTDIYGEVGVSSGGTLVFWDNKVSSPSWKTVYHSGNFTPSNYMPKSGGTFTGGVTGTSFSAATFSATTAFYQTSDETLKDFYNEIDVDFEKLKKIPKRYYKWKSDPEGDLEIGTSAQKVQELYPELVGKGEKLSVDYSKLSVVALKAVDKLYDENTELKAELSEVKKQNEILLNELNLIKKHLGL